MITVDLLSFVAAALAVCGLAAVAWEIAARDPRLFRDIIDDTRGFAERPLPAEPGEEAAGKKSAAAPPVGPEQSPRRAA